MTRILLVGGLGAAVALLAVLGRHHNDHDVQMLKAEPMEQSPWAALMVESVLPSSDEWTVVVARRPQRFPNWQDRVWIPFLRRLAITPTPRATGARKADGFRPLNKELMSFQLLPLDV